jgi:hypothetical protein
MDWQRRALAYIDIVPELSYSSRFYARMLRGLRIFPATMAEDGQLDPITSGEPVEILSRLKAKDGTMKPILGNYGRLMFSTGSGNLLGVDLDTDDESWMFVWDDEVKVETNNDGTVQNITWMPVSQSDGVEYKPDQARIYRMWSPHPRRSGEADSPMRSVLEIAEELVILTAAVRATAVSRTVHGLLLMPSEMAPLPAEDTGDEDPQGDPFVDEMLEHLETQVEDAGSAAAASPWVVWGAYEMLDSIRRVDLHDPQTDYMERDLRTEAINRMARGLDFPPEVLTGLSSANHWAAKQILDDMWRSHGSAVADQFAGDINDAYLRPALRAADYSGWENVVVGYDESRVVIPPDQSQDADAAHDRGAISNAGYRKLKNIPEAFEPSQEEHDEWLAIKLRNPALIGEEQAEADSDPSDGPPPPGREGDSGRDTRVVRAAAAGGEQIALELGAAELALARCRELAGIRIRQKEKLCPECLSDVNGKPNALLASALGPETLEQKFSLTPQQLVKGGADTLRSLLCEWGYATVQASAVAEMVESYAARTIFKIEHPTLPSGFVTQFERAKEASYVGD